MALLSPYAQFRIFPICIVVWKVLEYKHTSLRFVAFAASKN